MYGKRLEIFGYEVPYNPGSYGEDRRIQSGFCRKQRRRSWNNSRRRSGRRLAERPDQKTRELTDKPFGVNIMLLADNVDELMDVVCEEKVPVVTTGAGNLGKYISKLRECGIKVIPVVANVTLAIRVERAGADAVVAEGTEAGGHIGETTTMALCASDGRCA